MSLLIGMACLGTGIHLLVIMTSYHMEHGISTHQRSLPEHLIALIVSATRCQSLTISEHERSIMPHPRHQPAIFGYQTRMYTSHYQTRFPGCLHMLVQVGSERESYSCHHPTQGYTHQASAHGEGNRLLLIIIRHCGGGKRSQEDCQQLERQQLERIGEQREYQQTNQHQHERNADSAQTAKKDADKG